MSLAAGCGIQQLHSISNAMNRATAATIIAYFRRLTLNTFSLRRISLTAMADDGNSASVGGDPSASS